MTAPSHAWRLRVPSRSVDRGTCRPGVEPRKRHSSGRRRCRRKRKAQSGTSKSQGALESRAVGDPRHARKQLRARTGRSRVRLRQAGTRVASRSLRTYGDDERTQEVGQTRIATKFANKAGRPVAEQVERRGLAEGNSPRQNATRAQDRSIAQSALGRIRQAAKTG